MMQMSRQSELPNAIRTIGLSRRLALPGTRHTGVPVGHGGDLQDRRDRLRDAEQLALGVEGPKQVVQGVEHWRAG